MADSSIAITAGSGTNVDTRTEATSGHHRQVIVLGDPATNAGVAPVDATKGLAVNAKSGAIIGPADPTIDSYQHSAISSVTGANQALVSAPGASKQIWVYGIVIGVTNAGTVAFQDEDDTAITGAMSFADDGGMAITPSGNFAMPIWKLATNKALEVDVVTSTINGSITYAVVSV